MSQTTTTDPDAEPGPVRLADDVRVEDAFVDWNLNNASNPELVIRPNKPVTAEHFVPFRADPDDTIVTPNEYGVYFGLQAGCPVSEETGRGWSPTTFEHADLDEIERYEMLDHVLMGAVHDQDPFSALNVSVNPVEGYLTSHIIDVNVVAEIVEKYLNGPLGSDTQSYWLWKRDSHDWRRAVSKKANHESMEGAEIDLVAINRKLVAWHPIRSMDITDDHDVYPDHP